MRRGRLRGTTWFAVGWLVLRFEDRHAENLFGSSWDDLENSFDASTSFSMALGQVCTNTCRHSCRHKISMV